MFCGVHEMILRTVCVVLLLSCLANNSLQKSLPKTQDELKSSDCNFNQQEHPSSSDTIQTSVQLQALRKLMISESLQAVYVSTGDEHQSEFIADEDKRVKYISGFSGSNGEVLVTLTKAALWTDSRYHLQADQEVDCNWTVMKTGAAGVPTKTEWMKEIFPNGARIGADSKLLPANTWNSLEASLKAVNQKFSLVATEKNLIDEVWVNKQEAEIKPAFILTEYYSGKNWTSKVNKTLAEVQKLGANTMVVTALDEVAWLLNIRGQDIPYNYFLKAYIILTSHGATLYTDPKKVQGNVTEYFKNTSVKLKRYEDVWTDLKQLAEEDVKILIGAPCVFNLGASKKVADLIPEEKRISKPSPIIFLKAEKNAIERDGMRVSQIKDSAILIKFFHHLEESFNSGDQWDELKVAQEVDRFRYEQNSTPSFTTIAGFGPNGALPHYSPTASTSIPVTNTSIIVIDSGGHYYGGTTDTTRSVHLGKPTDFQKEIYTRVLMGSIQLSSLVFPPNMDASRMDVLARSALWEIGYDYGHGTGHGIGSYLGVHESPISISYGSSTSQIFKPGYFTSNEPGCYLEGKFGVRLENVIEVIEKPKLKDKRGHSYLGFQDVTLVPYDRKLIDFNMLNNNHIRWLNRYNTRIREEVGPELLRQNATEAHAWMLQQTQPIPEQQFIQH